jgi:hypothetical protein
MGLKITDPEYITIIIERKLRVLHMEYCLNLHKKPFLPRKLHREVRARKARMILKMLWRIGPK